MKFRQQRSRSLPRPKPPNFLITLLFLFASSLSFLNNPPLSHFDCLLGWINKWTNLLGWRNFKWTNLHFSCKIIQLKISEYMSKSRLILCHTQIQLQKHVKRLFCPSGRRIHYFSAYPKQNEMAYRFSCPYTHYHNGKVNKKHKHLIETSLTLTAQANMRLECWWEVSLTPTYLINMISTSVPDNISPL